jgi:cation diffusion facilitator CzcD-associated flavoprotein CzcO
MRTIEAPRSLAELERRLAQDLIWLNMPPKAWVPERLAESGRVRDVVVIGAGLGGLVALAALKMVGIGNTVAYDQAPEGREGPWVTFARMPTLRTRKEAAGPALGLAALTFRAWYEAQFGPAAFERMDLAPREIWMDYLLWYRRVLALPVENKARVGAVRLQDDGLIGVEVQQMGGTTRRVLARRLVLATGIDGLGGPSLPAVARRVAPRFVAHAAEPIDMQSLRGKRVAVVGAGASAMDNAAAVLEAGARRVDIFVRRPDIPRIDKFTGVGSKGMVHGYFGLPDADKWTLMVEGERAQIPPPRHSVLRVSRFANAFFHLSSPIDDLRETGGSVTVVTPKGSHVVDFVIFATGFGVDFGRRPEFAEFSDKVLLWRDVYRPPPGDRHEGLASTPYLGPHFEFLPKAGLAPAAASVSHIYCFAYPAVTSHGKITSGIPSISDGANRLAEGIARSLFVEDRDIHIADFRTYAAPELLGNEWRDADRTMEEGING